MKVEELPSYGKAFDHLPLRGQLLQAKVMLSELIKKFGWVGALGDEVNLDFRRPCTLANGDDACEFYYYRKGHAPQEIRTI